MAAWTSGFALCGEHGAREGTDMEEADSRSERPRTTPKDRRRHPRQAEGRPAWLHRGSSSSAVGMIDVSAGGACFMSSRALPIGKALRLQIGHGATQITLDGRVIRLLQRPDGQYEIGLRLDEMHGFEIAQRFPTRGHLTTRGIAPPPANGI